MDRDALVDLAVDRYFGNVARRNPAGVAAIFADDAVMEVATLAKRYEGKPAIVAHFEDFLPAYPRIEFADFRPTADPAGRSVAVRFCITLHRAEGGAPLVMRNCNFFYLNGAGLVQHVVIYMTDTPDRGF